MAIKVGTLSVDLVANTASFTGPLDKAPEHAKRSAAAIQRSFNDLDLGDARGGLVIIDELLGIHIPRHAAAFASQIPGVMQLAAAALPVAAFAAIGLGIFNATQKLKEQREELERVKIEALDNALAMGKHAEALQVANLKMQDQIAILNRLPARNGLVIASLEAKKAIDDLIDELQKAIDKESELLGKQEQGIWNKILFGDKDVNDLIGEAKKFRTEIDEVIKNRNVASGLGRQDEVKQYQKELDDKVVAFRNYLSQQQGALDEQDHEARRRLADRIAASSVPPPPKSIQEAEQQITDSMRDRQDILNDLIILTTKYGEAEKQVARQGKLSGELVDAQKFAEARKVYEEFSRNVYKEARDINDKIVAENIAGVDRGVHAQLQWLNERRAIFAIDQDTARQHAEALGTLEEQRLNLQRQLGRLSEGDYEKLMQARLTATYTEARKELEIKLAAAKADSVQEAQIRQQLQRLDDNYTLQTERIEQQSLLRRANQWRQLSSTITNSFSGWLRGSETFAQSWNKMWIGMTTTAIESLVQVGIQELIGLAIHQSIADKKKLTDAKSAFHGAYAATAGIPVIGPVLAPIAGATAFAAVMAFRQGGIVPEDTFAMVHQNEMVLPAPVSNFILNSVSSGNGNGGGHQILFAPRITAMDAEGVDRVLTKHQAVFKRHIHALARRMNYA